MLSKYTVIKTVFIISLFSTIFFSLNVTAARSAVNSETPMWSKNLGHTRCSPYACETSSPALADLTGDGILDIVLATSNGWVMAYKNNGQLIWEKDVASAFGMSANTQHIHSSPAIADIDNDGKLEIVVGTGASDSSFCTQGGVIALDHKGNVQPGEWPFFTADDAILPVGCTDTVFSTPALGDLDNDGDMEIVVGSFDKRIYVLHHNGVVDSHFPIDSAHSTRFPWDNLKGKLADTIWSSPALADMNSDGYLDIILGTDEGNFGPSFGSWPDNWICPYSLPDGWNPDYCGGALYVIDRQGNHLPGFPKRIHETIQSSPAIYDIDQDGSPEIFVGAGTYYYTASPDNPTVDFRIYGWDNRGNDLPGWEGGKVTGGSTPASPAIGDIAGDRKAEIIALGMDKKLYAWNINGTPISGFPMTPKDGIGNSNSFNVGYSPILGDYDGDGKMEIFMRTTWHITVVDGDGMQLTRSSNSSLKPLFDANNPIENNPAVGDIDNDGKLELVAHNTTLYVWDLPNAGSKADWPMFKHDAARTGSFGQPILQVNPNAFSAFHLVGDSSDIEFDFMVKNAGIGCINWQAIATQQVNVLNSPVSGQVCEGKETAVSVTISTDSLVMGQNNFGEIMLTGTVDGTPVVGSPHSIPLTVYQVNEIYRSYLPIIQK